ncbi:PREDICTED: 39S ribosomal protein L13, mitochondrial isoform X3 [Haliaeetus leucocephalus]|uniref:39S ribosomal protein L13, mitochondrial isoform X3 n=1 Tax=Haliaeetus leucocephalus TaxID=52644 RepID=UPI00053CEB2B|nr:PREDICTED: 39S ribosomal protein L13, mitochondrial isoform X3 [Haliaeetus leucocephalus]
MASYTKAAQQWATFARAWYLLDAKMQPPGKIAAATVIRLEGRHKPIYHALSDCGDHVVIINTRHIAFSGNKWEQKVYSSHTGYPGGFKQVTATQLHLKDPTAIVKLTVYRMLPKNLQRRTMMQRLHLFPEDVIPEDIQKNLLQEIPQPRAVPKRLDEYTPEEIAAFPKVWTPEEDRCILQCLEFLGCWKSNGSVPAELTAGILQSSKDSMNFRGDTVC